MTSEHFITLQSIIMVISQMRPFKKLILNRWAKTDVFHLTTSTCWLVAGLWRLLVGQVDEERDRSANSLLRPGQVLRLTQKVQDKEWVGWRKSLLWPTWSSSDDRQALITSNKQTSWNTIKHNPLLSSQCDRPVFSLKKESIEQTHGCLKYEKKYAFIGFPMMLNCLLRTPNRMF